MFCPDCNTNLDAGALRRAVPSVRWRTRSAVAAPQTVTATVSIPEPTIIVTRGDRRPWFEKWQEVLRARDQIDEVYAQREPGVGNADVDERVMRFCSECHDMRDWFIGDLGALAGVTANDVTRHAASSPPLTVSSAMANSNKHHTRTRGTTARIRAMHMTPQGARVTIEVDWATPAATNVDALALANDCVASWRQFFAGHGIVEP